MCVDGQGGAGLQATEYWTETEAPTAGDSWWSQSNWFRSTVAKNENAAAVDQSQLSPLTAQVLFPPLSAFLLSAAK
jgi:hypothetical protein